MPLKRPRVLLERFLPDLDTIVRCFPDLEKLTMDADTLDTRVLAKLRTLEELRLIVDKVSQLAFVRHLESLRTLEIVVESEDHSGVLVLPPGLRTFVCNSLNHLDSIEVPALLDSCLESLTLPAALLTSCPAKWIEGLRSLTCGVSSSLQQVVGGLRQLRRLHLICSSRQARLDDVESSSVTSLVLQDFLPLPDSSWLRGFPVLAELDLHRCDEEAARSWTPADMFQICASLTRVVMPSWSTFVITFCRSPDGRIVRRVDGKIVAVL
jgi:hypothetical protein